MSSRYPHTCTITRPGTDGRPIDEESGQPIGAPPAGVTVYTGRCRWEDDGSKVMREKGGNTDIEGDSMLALPKEAAVFDQETDVVTVTANGVTFTGRIVRPRYHRNEVTLLLAPDEQAVAA